MEQKQLYVVAPTTARVDLCYGPLSLEAAQKLAAELGLDWRVLRLIANP